ncbi:sulfotransferase [Candidatus Leptofilum sp.]|uniref:sulfotransferase n=1 Tax=Candidatus Leptofilum sp. TaxID=3241576 RepID=UPI003B5C7142
MKGIFKKLFGSSKPVVTVVSGLPRSGTSMMMKMLEAGGIPPVTDKIRTADDDNPKGYYEFERVKQMDKGDTAWMEDAQGKSVKVISQLLRYMPDEYEYKVIFMRRNMSEILASQKKMLINRGEDPEQATDEEISALFEKHLNSVMDWMAARPNVSVIYIHYSDMLANPAPQVAQINEFLGGNMNIQAMSEVVDPNLYRNRKNRLQKEKPASS